MRACHLNQHYRKELKECGDPVAAMAHTLDFLLSGHVRNLILTRKARGCNNVVRHALFEGRQIFRALWKRHGMARETADAVYQKRVAQVFSKKKKGD